MAIKVNNTPKDFSDTLSVYNDLISFRNGGGFTVLPTGITEESPPVSLARPNGLVNPELGYKPFIISIYNQQRDLDVFSLALMVNPSDINIGQTFVSSDAYTRKGWLSTLWGNNQKTINANCTTTGFFVSGIGVTNFLRNFSVSFKNFAAFLGFFKNSGYSFMSGDFNKDLFETNPGLVIGVMDQIKISYDNTNYLGSFSALTIDENAEMPYRIQFNFEFVVSGLVGDEAEGHLKYRNGNYDNSNAGIKIAVQGFYNNQNILDIKQLSESEISEDPSNISDSVESTELRSDGLDSQQVVKIDSPREYSSLSTAGIVSTNIEGISFVEDSYKKGALDKFNDLQPEVQRKFIAMAKEFREETGYDILVTETFRSEADQQRLYDKYKDSKSVLVAKPGTSKHEKGLALDINSQSPGNGRLSDADYLDTSGLLAKYGFERTVLNRTGKEAWHIEYVGTNVASSNTSGGES